jgi:hypothetical protein
MPPPFFHCGCALLAVLVAAAPPAAVVSTWMSIFVGAATCCLQRYSDPAARRIAPDGNMFTKAPEAMPNEGFLSPANDVYSLGISMALVVCMTIAGGESLPLRHHLFPGSVDRRELLDDCRRRLQHRGERSQVLLDVILGCCDSDVSRRMTAWEVKLRLEADASTEPHHLLAKSDAVGLARLLPRTGPASDATVVLSCVLSVFRQSEAALEPGLEWDSFAAPVCTALRRLLHDTAEVGAQEFEAARLALCVLHRAVGTQAEAAVGRWCMEELLDLLPGFSKRAEVLAAACRLIAAIWRVEPAHAEPMSTSEVLDKTLLTAVLAAVRMHKQVPSVQESGMAALRCLLVKWLQDQGHSPEVVQGDLRDVSEHALSTLEWHSDTLVVQREGLLLLAECVPHLSGTPAAEFAAQAMASFAGSEEVQRCGLQLLLRLASLDTPAVGVGAHVHVVFKAMAQHPASLVVQGLSLRVLLAMCAMSDARVDAALLQHVGVVKSAIQSFPSRLGVDGLAVLGRVALVAPAAPVPGLASGMCELVNAVMESGPTLTASLVQAASLTVLLDHDLDVQFSRTCLRLVEQALVEYHDLAWLPGDGPSPLVLAFRVLHAVLDKPGYHKELGSYRELITAVFDLHSDNAEVQRAGNAVLLELTRPSLPPVKRQQAYRVISSWKKPPPPSTPTRAEEHSEPLSPAYHCVAPGELCKPVFPPFPPYSRCMSCISYDAPGLSALCLSLLSASCTRTFSCSWLWCRSFGQRGYCG